MTEELTDLLTNHRTQLRRMVSLRMDQRLNGRVDPSDVIQDAFLEASERYPEYQQQPDVSPFVWLRFLTAQKLAQIHRFHLGTQARNADREVSITGGPWVEASSAVLAAQLAGRFSSPSNAVRRAEQKQVIQDVLNAMEEHDREILALRHFEQLDNQQTAEVLGIRPEAAYKRYIRAIRRLRNRLREDESDLS